MSEKINRERFVDLLQKRWANLIFCRVTTIKTPNTPVSTSHHIMFRDGSFTHHGLLDPEMDYFKQGKGNPCFTGALGSKVQHTYQEIDATWEAHYYEDYFGFCRPIEHYPFQPEMVKTRRDIYFNSKQYIPINLYESCWFDNYRPLTSIHAPISGDIICGIVTQSPQGLKFDRWFVCSPNFYSLWKLIMLGQTMDMDLEIIDSFDLVLDRKFRSKDQVGFKYSKDQILKQYDPNYDRIQNLSPDWLDIVKFYLNNQKIVPFTRDRLPKLSKSDIKLIHESYKPKKSTQSNNMWVAPTPLVVKIMNELLMAEQYKFANIFDRKTYKYQIKELINY